MKKMAAWVLCALWMGFIFYMSAQTGEASGEQSGRIMEMVVSVLEEALGEEAVQALDRGMLEFAIRKCAHMAEYAVLFLLMERAMRLSDFRRPALSAFFWSVLYASGDELHQAFTPDRGPSPVDVMIDSAGMGLGALWLQIWNKLRGMRKKRTGKQN